MFVSVVEPDTTEAAKKMADELGLTFIDCPPDDYFLCFEKGRLVVKDPRQGAHFSIRLDYEKELEQLKRQRISVKKDLLSRAVGFKGQENYTVFDGTLGMGKDSVHLIGLGCQVVASETDPVAFALVRDALTHFSYPFEIILGDTYENIQEYSGHIDCLYLDPMFEDIKKKSAPKKGMAFLRAREVERRAIEDVIPVAQEQGVKRIVVKRPIKGKQLYLDPQMSIAGNLIRYDIYLS